LGFKFTKNSLETLQEAVLYYYEYTMDMQSDWL